MGEEGTGAPTTGEDASLLPAGGGSGRCPVTTADLVLLGARVHTLDPANPTASAVAIGGDGILAVGSESNVLGLRGAGTEVIDLGGAVVTPGFVDGHAHPVSGVEMTTGVDLSSCRTLEELRRALAATAAATPTDGWVRGWGLDPNCFGDQPIAAAVIDGAVGRRPASLLLFDGHAILASTEALRRAGITGPRRFSSTAAVVCDQTGQPTGHLLEEGAMALVREAMPAAPASERATRLRDQLLQMAATGLTGIHVMDGDAQTLELIGSLDDAGQLPLRMRFAPRCRPEDDRDRRQELIAMQTRSGRMWQVAAVKLFMDGTIDGGTAWLEQPDCHGESTASYWQDPGDYTAAVRQFAAAGVQTATHAIGDAAVAHVLNALEGAVRGQVVHRVEHLETLPDETVSRFASLGVAASMQPTHATDYTRADHSDNWSQRLGDERADRAWRCRDLVDAGATLVLGSDWPIAPYDPRLTLAAAQHRRPARDLDAAPVNPAQGLTAWQALVGYTSAPSLVAGDQERTGRVAPGMRADLTVFGDDPLVVPAADVADLPVQLTIVDGVVRHRASDLG
jgi:predicted amidohydrolase YtcJ